MDQTVLSSALKPVRITNAMLTVENVRMHVCQDTMVFIVLYHVSKVHSDPTVHKNVHKIA